MATDWHRHEQISVFNALYGRFAGPNCYVSFDRWLQLSPANPNDRLPADIHVALGIPDRKEKDVYIPSEEGKAPDLIAEFLSKESRTSDRRVKPVRYAKLGVREYLLFNPGGEFPDARIQGWTLFTSGDRVANSIEPDGGVNSQVLPVRFALIDGNLAILDQVTGDPLTPLEVERLARARETARADAAEAETRRLRAELDRLQAHGPQ